MSTRDAPSDNQIKARLAFLSQPSDGVCLINLQFENGANLRIELSKAQLANIVVDGSRMALGTRIEAAERT